MIKFKNIELRHAFSIFIKKKFKNIEAQISEILSTPSLGQNLLVLIEECMLSHEYHLHARFSHGRIIRS